MRIKLTMKDLSTVVLELPYGENAKDGIMNYLCNTNNVGCLLSWENI